MQGFNVLYPQGFHATGEPILGAIERLKQGDKTQIETFKLYGASNKDIQDFIKFGPEFVARYWMKCWIEDLKLAGFSIDWRRTFITAITPTYNRFIEWQYNTLKKKGYVTQGTHPVVWCPHCQSPTGDHDRLKGEGESPIEYVIIKFKLGTGEIIPTGTLRPETMYGATNIWINPDINYVWAQVENEKWLLSEKAAEKLKDQLKKVEIIGKTKGNKLIGRYVENPVTKNKMIILPASLVDPSSATGIVVSVPSHAPYDWIALVDLKKNSEELKKYGLDLNKVNEVKPISLIKVEGFGEHPAGELCEQLEIKSQNDKEKLEKATSILYKKEYHTGILKENCQEYSGSKVAQVKEKIIEDWKGKNIVDIMWEITGPVVCRCTTPNHVKILENQWFLKFSDETWKGKVKSCISQMKFYPEEARIQFLNTVDWLKDKACTRKTGLGTRLPWDKDWLIETLSDSVIYMAFYTIAKVLNEKKIPAEKLTDEVFDYIFLGKGNTKEISKKVKISQKIIEDMKNEFEYFYPVDLRNSGKDLIQNHLTFYLFHHVAIWNNPKYWPKAIGANGFVQVSGEKMSKRLGNIIPLKELVKKYSADIVRINIVSSNENMDDADWREGNVQTFVSRVGFLNELTSNFKKAKRTKILNIDKVLQSKAQTCIKSATESYELMKFRSATQATFFDFTNDIKTYVERCKDIKNCNKKVLLESLTAIIKLINPLIPHTCEELWNKIGNKSFVATEKWPEADETKIDKNILESESVFVKTVEDLRQILKLTGQKNNAYLYFVTDKELDFFQELLDFVKEQFKFKDVKIYKTSDPKKYDPQNKSSKAKYGKPGIYLM
jgi:leucyl-tRNA synthetase